MTPGPVVLASTSPRRRDLLNQIGLEFTPVSPEFDESIDESKPVVKLAADLAYGKALSVVPQHAGATVIGADTLISFNGRVLGKPASPRAAREMLRLLSGSTHSVVTGLAVISGAETFVEAVETRVTLVPMAEEEIEDYVASGEPLDKAGSYAIQGRGAVFVNRIEGDFSAVVGLPLPALARTLRKLGYVIPAWAQGT